MSDLHDIIKDNWPEIVPKPNCGYGCGEGWWPLVFGLCQWMSDLRKATGHDIVLMQVKEKFGGLRFYTGSLPAGDCVPGMPEDLEREVKQFEEAVDACERLSYRICERCGMPGKLRERAWMLTLCDACNSTPKPSSAFLDALAKLDHKLE